jgi:hypothetical protein
MKTSTMKNVIMGSVLAVAAISSLSANAANICTGGVAGDGAPVTSGANAFVKVAFTPKCSANVFLSGEDVSPTVYKVGAASVKGKSIFAGSSLGGAVGNVGECAGVCSQAKVNTAVGEVAGS